MIAASIYTTAANRAYTTWLMTKMYTPPPRDMTTIDLSTPDGVFLRGADLNNQGVWVNDPIGFFSPDTTHWIPFDDMMADPNFPWGYNSPGVQSTRLQRLQAIEYMVRKTELLAGVHDNNHNLLGMSFSVLSAANKVITIEWSSQMALLYLRIAYEYAALRNNAKSQDYLSKHDDLIRRLDAYFSQSPPFYAPYAVYGVSINGHQAGDPAFNEPTYQGWSVAPSRSALASVYYAFAVSRIDPLNIDRAMATQRKMTLPKAQASVTGGIDLTPVNTNLLSQNNGAEMKFHLDRAQLVQLQKAPGFTPVIINIQPLKDISLFLGLN